MKCCSAINRLIHLVGGVTGRAGAGAADSTFVAFMSTVLKGKVRYTPDNNKTRLVIKKMKSFITQVYFVLSSLFI